MYRIARCEDMIQLILGGTEADRTDFPHMASIGFGFGRKLSYKCGGTLISEKFVMTAAHCKSDRTRFVKRFHVHSQCSLISWRNSKIMTIFDSGRATVVRLGSVDQKLNDEHTKIIAIKKFIVHPEYTSRSKYNDIALVEMAHNVYFTDFILPACINTDINIEWDTATATGFGLTSHGN